MNITELLYEEKTQIERELAQYEQKRKRLTLINELLKSYGKNEEGGISPSNRFAEMGITDAIFRFLEERPTEAFTPREIAEELRSGGLVPKSENFLNIIHTTCSRKAELQELAGVNKNGKRAFRLPVL
jgi:hypothetical protein